MLLNAQQGIYRSLSFRPRDPFVLAVEEFLCKIFGSDENSIPDSFSLLCRVLCGDSKKGDVLKTSSGGNLGQISIVDNSKFVVDTSGKWPEVLEFL